MKVQLLGQDDYLGERNGNQLEYSCLGDPMDRGACWATVYGVAKSRTLSSIRSSQILLMCILWGRARTLLQGCTIVSSLLLPWLCTPVIPGLGTVQICPLKKDHGGWSLLPPRNKGHRKASVPRSPTGSCLVSGSPDRVKNLEFILIQLSMSGVRPFKWHKNTGPSRLYRL